MRVSTLAALSLAPLAFAQNSTSGTAYLTAVLGALTAANLTSLAGIATELANTTVGQQLFTTLSSGNHTVFAPTNAAFANISSSIDTSNTTILGEILAYHITQQLVTASGVNTAPNHTIVRTALNFGGYGLPNNMSAPLVLSTNMTNATSFMINQATDNITASMGASAANLMVYPINEVISLPANLSALATQLFPSLAGVIQQVGLLQPLVQSPAITVFAPNNAAIQNAMSTLGMLNSTQITSVLANHVINGTIVYSPSLTSSNYTSAGGEPFMFSTNSTGTFVTSGNSTAQIVQSDIIIQNGVVHLINGVLANPMMNAAAASSAYSSNTAAAATMTANTAPLTATSSMSTASSSSSAKSGAGQAVSLNINAVVGGAMAVAGAVLGGGYLMM